MAYDPNFPPPNAEMISAEFRAQFQGLLDAAAPIGCVKSWLKNFPGVPALSAQWAECNGQVLSDAGSPLNGQTLPDLNGEQRFLRGASASGGTGGSDTHAHTTTQDPGNNGNNNAGSFSEASGTTSVEFSLPRFYEVVWVMRVK